MNGREGINRPRVATAFAIGITILLGLGSRAFADYLPPFIAEYAGDALWASMIYFAAETIWNRAHPMKLAVGAAVFCFAIEVSQLYRAPWIDAIRATRMGALALGHGFLWSDFACYTAGVAGACAADLLWLARSRTRSAEGH